MADWLRKIWPLIRGSGALRFFSLTFLGGAGLAAGGDATLGIFSWLTKLANHFIGTPIYEAESTHSWIPQVLGAAICLLSMYMFYRSSLRNSKDQENEGKVNFKLSEDTELRHVLEMLADMEGKPLVLEELGEKIENLEVKKGNYKFDSVIQAMKAVKSSIRQDTFIEYDVAFVDGTIKIDCKGGGNAKL